MPVTTPFTRSVRAKVAKRPQRMLHHVVMAGALGLALAILACAGAVAVTSAPRPCPSITDDGARLACYDEHVGRKPTPPAKGALAPPLPAHQQ